MARHSGTALGLPARRPPVSCKPAVSGLRQPAPTGMLKRIAATMIRDRVLFESRICRNRTKK
jgi:hypothetical protein